MEKKEIKTSKEVPELEDSNQSAMEEETTTGTTSAAEDKSSDFPDDDKNSPWGEEGPEAEIADLKDKLLRALAENENTGLSDLDKGITMGLYNYPILMAADILMFNADIVPVGQDQKQHIEMTRDIALRFNHHYGELLTPPEAQISETTGILPGLDGRKMSKSYNNTIPIFLDEKKLKKSVMKIKTNSLEPGEPKDSSTCTVFSLYKAISSESDLNELQSQYDNGIAWGEAKTILFDRLNEFLKPYKNEYDRIIEDRGYVEQVLMDGANTAKEVSTPLIEKIRSAVGIRGF